jgi:hypothetical protein
MSDKLVPEPGAAEVESARLLANEARRGLRLYGSSDEEIRRLADEFVVRHPNLDPSWFVPWAIGRHQTSTDSGRVAAGTKES